MARYADTPHGGGGGRKPKIFVLDTNIILHDHKAIRKFQDNDLVIPIAVIEELDKFKKGNDNLAFNARGFMRDIDRITDGKSFGKYGVPIGRGLGNIRIDPGHPFPESMKGMPWDSRTMAPARLVRRMASRSSRAQPLATRLAPS